MSYNPDNYYEVHVPLSSSNVRSVTLSVCRRCGSFVFDRTSHDEHHEEKDRCCNALVPGKHEPSCPRFKEG